MTQKHFATKLGGDLFINLTVLPSHAPSKPQGINHVLIFDCSGSMTYELPSIADHIKNKLYTLLDPADTISAIWFSGQGQSGVIFENVKPANLLELDQMKKGLARWLRPIGLTGFVDPLRILTEICLRFKQSGNLNPVSVFFLSDGQENQNSPSLVRREVFASGSLLSAATVVEYGPYADRQMLSDMAAAWGGSHIMSSDFEAYTPAIESHVGRTVSRRVEYSIPLTNGLAYSIGDGVIETYEVVDGKVLLPEHVKSLFWIGESPDRAEYTSLPIEAYYALLYVYGLRMKPGIIYPALQNLGDVALIKQYAGCFGKQKYTDFCTRALACTFDADQRFHEGINRNLIPPKDSFTIMDLLRLLTPDDYIDIKTFEQYQRTSRKSVQMTKVDLGDDLRAKLLDLANGKDADPEQVKAAQTALADAVGNVPVALKFVPYTQSKFPADNLIPNSSRANVGILIRRGGEVDLKSVLPETMKSVFPEGTMETHIWRDYLLIKDGDVHVGKLMLHLCQETLIKIDAQISLEKLDQSAVNVGFPYDDEKRNVRLTPVTFDLSKIPVVNRQSVESVSALDLFKKEMDLLNLKAEAKVFGYYLDQLREKFSSPGLAEIYSVEAATFLAEYGITDNGFSPKGEKAAEPVDYYLSKTLVTKIAKLSSLPKVEETATRGPKTEGDKLLYPCIKAYENLRQTITRDAALVIELESRLADLRKQIRSLQYQIAEIKFSVIAGQVWFKEFANLEENSLEMELADTSIKCSIVMEEKKVFI